MAKVEIVLPSMGEGIVDATLTQWLVSIGDTVEEDQSLAEIATDKVDSELPSPADGVIKELLVKDGDVPKVGETIAIMETEGEGEEEAADTSKETQKEKETAKEEHSAEEKEIPGIGQLQEKQEESSPAKPGSHTPEGKFLSPLVRSIAEEEGISAKELDQIRGSGNTGRITKNDVFEYLKTRGSQPQAQPSGSQPQKPAATQQQQAAAPAPPATVENNFVKQAYQGNYEVVEMDRMRKLIADHMVQSKRISPHVTSFVEADVTGLVNWRNRMKKQFMARDNVKLTFTPLFIEATVKALKDFPMVNVAVDGEKIIVRKDINLGMATALPSGNLIVPVIKHADRQNLLGLSTTVNDLAHRARENKLQPDEIQGGTFTITNFGTFGNISGTPIINQPQVAILGVGSIEKKPAVVETDQGDMIAIRHKMIISLAYDHRVVDGALGGMFLKRVADYLEDFDTERTI
jgi:2-oxoglutarate dehydrogenase E2 component (dihydrolipoamide succinyltransferase)